MNNIEDEYLREHDEIDGLAHPGTQQARLECCQQARIRTPGDPDSNNCAYWCNIDLETCTPQAPEMAISKSF
ncbi:hypothetical protein LIA77_00739 [Sarocladium implicatum]|nr:hypothetical protein LIA77_00739 [Sarocladium implicatum]